MTMGPLARLSAFALLAAASGSGSGQTTPAPADQATVPTGTGAGSNGRIAVNIAAGDRNQQVGSAVLAIGANASGGASIRQAIDDGTRQDRATRVAVEGNAFAHSQGLISLNVTAGSENQMANSAVFSLGIEGLAASDMMLEQSRASTQPNGGPRAAAGANDNVTVGDGVLRDSSGLIQVNLVGGERNTSANSFVLNVSAGSHH